MIRLYVAHEARNVIHVIFPGSLGLEATPVVDHDLYEFDEATNPVLATIVNSPERDHLTITPANEVIWRGAIIPVAQEHEQTLMRRNIEQSFRRVFDPTANLFGKDIRMVLQVLAQRCGISLSNDQIIGL